MNPSGIDANESVGHRSSEVSSLKYLQRYGLAVVSIGIALAISLLLQHFGFRVPSALLLLFAVAISSWYGGRGPAVLAGILSTISFYWYFVEPTGTIYVYRSEIAYFIIFTAFVALLSWFGTVRRRGEAALREKADLLNLTHDTVFVMDMDWVIKYWNRGAEERYGWNADQAVGKVAPDLLKTVLPAPLEEIKAEVTRAGRWEGELLHTKKDGSRLVVASRWSLERGKRGEPVAILETNNDITERKRAEETLEKERKRMEVILSALDTGLSLINPDMTIAWVNQKVREMFPVGEPVGQVCHAFYESRETICEGCGTLRAFSSGKVVESEQLVPRVGRWYHIISQPIKDTSGHVVNVLEGITDITERKLAEAALRRSEAYLAEAQRLTHTGAWATDAAPKPLYWSEELFRLYGLDPQQGLPTHDQAVQRVHPEDRDSYVQAFHRVIFQKEDSDVEFRTVLPDGTIRYLYGLGHPILNTNGDVVEVVGTTVDITERKRAEEERTRLRQLEADLAHINRVSMMGELVASVAHEVNQPLAGVVSNASACLRWLAGEMPNVEEAREAARRIVRDGKRAGEVIARIRALTRRAEMPREKLGLNDTMREVLVLVGDEAKRRSTIIRTQFAEDLSAVSGDRVQLQQVVLNLVMNGIEAMSSVGERARELLIATRNVDADRVQVSVEDSGIGIDPEKLDKIFDSFYTTKPGGMGMGLSVSRSILQAHGGRLWATTKDGTGTIFYFTLPKYHEEESNAGVTAV